MKNYVGDFVSKLWNYIKNNWDSLPKDYITKAAQRMREDYAKTEKMNLRDVRIALGDPNTGVEICIGESLEDRLKRFKKRR